MCGGGVIFSILAGVASFDRYNEKADVHSFGVVVWELVTGWLPFAGISPPQFMYQVVKVKLHLCVLRVIYTGIYRYIYMFITLI